MDSAPCFILFLRISCHPLAYPLPLPFTFSPQILSPAVSCSSAHRAIRGIYIYSRTLDDLSFHKYYQIDFFWQ
jgi:hypothetical protein